MWRVSVTWILNYFYSFSKMSIGRTIIQTLFPWYSENFWNFLFEFIVMIVHQSTKVWDFISRVNLTNKNLLNFTLILSLECEMVIEYNICCFFLFWYFKKGFGWNAKKIKLRGDSSVSCYHSNPKLFWYFLNNQICDKLL